MVEDISQTEVFFRTKSSHESCNIAAAPHTIDDIPVYYKISVLLDLYDTSLTLGKQGMVVFLLGKSHLLMSSHQYYVKRHRNTLQTHTKHKNKTEKRSE